MQIESPMLEAVHAIAQSRLHTGFLMSAARYPDHVALSIGQQQWTYAEIEISMKPLSEIPEVAASSTAYLLYTSGSTGKPNGVPITHANVCYFLRINSERYQINQEDTLTQIFDHTHKMVALRRVHLDSILDQFLPAACREAPHNGSVAIEECEVAQVGG
jgi:acyl-coenzyme A synthetase/AMP-(fatty) acid ligase